jgi:two-component system, OmpR family, phosphate regulon sensor histidine kinase PhoR
MSDLIYPGDVLIMKKKYIISKIYGWYFLIVCVFTLVYSFIFFNIERNSDINNEFRYLTGYAKLLEKDVSLSIKNKEYNQMELYLKEFSKDSNTRITVVDKEGLVLLETETKPDYMENHIERPEIKAALSGKLGKYVRYSGTLHQEMVYLAIPVKNDKNEVIAALRTSYLLNKIEISIIKIIFKLIPAIFIMALISVLFIKIIHSIFKKSINNFANASLKIAERKFNVKLPIKEFAEVDKLYTNFNIMSDKIMSAFNELSYEKEELNSIISSIKEGVVVIDKKGRIDRVNASFLKMFHINDVTGKYYWEIIRNNDIIDIIKNAGAENKIVTREVELLDRTYICNSVCLTQKEEYVLVFSDVTELAQIENIKKDFVANVSHELNTPLSAIKGYIETLLEDENDSRKVKYLEIIKKHSERLAFIVKDLLMLSKLDEKKNFSEKVSIKVSDVIDNILPLFNEKISEKKIDLKINIEENLAITCDVFNLEQMFINLIDNAIKYTDKGEIIVSVIKENDKIKIGIEDTGIGIPEKDIPRIFERFYVVDKSRSRLSGGTGLGLSIVKHIVLSQNGEISVDSIIGKGTKFTIVLPQ